MRLVCVPHAGAAASVYRQWPRRIPRDVEVLSVQLPGRETRIVEPALTSLAEVIERLAVALEPWLDRPYALFGHSMGALIVYELARSLQRRAQPGPTHLFVSGQAAPHRQNRHRALHRLGDEDLLAALRELTTRRDAAMEDAELMRLLLPTLRADCALCATYEWKPAPPLDCAITAFGGRDDRFVTRADLEAWKRHTSGPFDLRTFPGDHFFVHSARAGLLRAVAARLRRTAPAPARPTVQGCALLGS
jgi:medium-chain acyl-[acyl-carrier-protein] hydrolase